MADISDGPFISARNVASRYNVSLRTLSRWTNDLSLNFPTPVVIRERRYWRESLLVAFERRRAASKQNCD